MSAMSNLNLQMKMVAEYGLPDYEPLCAHCGEPTEQVIGDCGALQACPLCGTLHETVEGILVPVAGQ